MSYDADDFIEPKRGSGCADMTCGAWGCATCDPFGQEEEPDDGPPYEYCEALMAAARAKQTNLNL